MLQQRAHAVANREALDPFANLADRARHFCAWRERQLWTDLVLALRDQDVEEVAARGAYIDDDLPRIRRDRGELLAL